MAKIIIYGTSDDLVEVEGDVPGCDEYGAWHSPRYVQLSTGDVFRVEYTDDGVWRIGYSLLGASGAVKIDNVPADGADTDNYTDRMTVEGPIEWVEVWRDWPATTEEVRRKLGVHLNGDDDFDTQRILTDDDVHEIWRIVSQAKRRKK